VIGVGHVLHIVLRLHDGMQIFVKTLIGKTIMLPRNTHCGCDDGRPVCTCARSDLPPTHCARSARAPLPFPATTTNSACGTSTAFARLGHTSAHVFPLRLARARVCPRRRLALRKFPTRAHTSQLPCCRRTCGMHETAHARPRLRGRGIWTNGELAGQDE
jgi:hypothetical protein